MRRFVATAIFSCAVFSCTQTPADVVFHADPATLKAHEQQAQGFVSPFHVTVESGDNVYTLAKRYQISTRDIIDQNRLKAPFHLKTGQVLKIPRPVFHTVKQKDTLYNIAKSYNLSIKELIANNQLDKPYTLQIGQTIHLTKKEENPTAANKKEKNVVVAANLPEIEVKTEKTPSEIIIPQAWMKTDTAPAPRPRPKHVAASSSHPTPKLKKRSDAPQKMTQATDLPQPRLRPQQKQVAQKITKPTPSPKVKSFSKEASATTVAKNKNLKFIWPVRGSIISEFGPKKGGLYNDGINISAKEGAAIKAAEDGTVVYAGNQLRGYGHLVLIKHPDGYLTAYAHNQRNTVKKGDIIRKGQVIGYVGATGHVKKPQLHFSIRKGRKAVDPKKHLNAMKLASR